MSEVPSSIIIEYGPDTDLHRAAALPGSPVEAGTSPEAAAAAFKAWVVEQFPTNEVLSETIFHRLHPDQFYAVHERLSRPLWRASCLQAEPPVSVGTLMVATTEHDVMVEQMLVGAFLGQVVLLKPAV